jgi:hypothetical protein
MRRRRTILLAALATAVVLALGGATWAIAGGGDDEGSASGPEANRAKAAAIAHVGGTANAVERDDEKGATWEVEVTKPSGETVDVRLDADYRVVAVDADSETANEADDGEGDG